MLKRRTYGQRRPDADPGSPYASSMILRDGWHPFHQRNPSHQASSRRPGRLDFATRRCIFTRGAASWVLKGKVIADDLPAEITTFPPSTAPCDDLILSILYKHDASSKRGKRERLEGDVAQEVTSEGSVPDQRDVGCSISHRDDVSSSGEQGQHSSGVRDDRSSKRRIFIRPETRSLSYLLYNARALTRP
ncbi:hypothetical protein EV421DRAFT_1818102 [Armillaria borealis]|uniref:Uncharacterized protein n=1 Tax=Armillaria borealis TaxID=47425 RepID=A0AA39JDX3_9AGAR|nr:hypothetical protein EV421DRAFT_1818102 [Armillaria borealis]